MKSELIKRLFRAIASNNTEAIDKLVHLVIEDERKKGHSNLATQLEKIIKNKMGSDRLQSSNISTSGSILSTLTLSNRSNTPLLAYVPREKLKYHTIFPENIEKRFQRIEKEYAARDRLAHHGFLYRQKILLFGSPGCGKTMGAERLAWNTGLPLLKVRFDSMVSSYLGETGSNLRSVFDAAAENPCLLFFDECDSIAKSREDTQEVGEIKRVVNSFLQILDEYESNSGLLVAATNLNNSLDNAIWRRFDDAIEVSRPGKKELESIVRQTLSAVDIGSINWQLIIQQMEGFSAAQAVRIAQDAAKRSILEREELVIQEHLEEAIADVG